MTKRANERGEDKDRIGDIGLVLRPVSPIHEDAAVSGLTRVRGMIGRAAPSIALGALAVEEMNLAEGEGKVLGSLAMGTQYRTVQRSTVTKSLENE